MKIHIVQKGDTLFEIAKQYDVDFEELVKVNPQLASPDSIVPGMKLRIPSASKQIKGKIDKKDRTNEETKENKSKLQEGVTKRPIGESIADDHMKRNEDMDTYPRNLRPFHPNQFMMNEYIMNPEARPIGFQIQGPMHYSQHEVNESTHDQAKDHPRCCHCHREMDMKQPTYYELKDKQQPNSNGIPFVPIDDTNSRMKVNPIKTFKFNNN